MSKEIFTKQETILKLQIASKRYKSISELLKKEGRTYYYMVKYNLHEYKKMFIKQKYSTPQLICKYILENIFNEKCLYNNRKILDCKLEIDIYFPNIKFACEYNGFYWHRNTKNTDEYKYKKCKEKNINLIVIKEPNYNAYCTFNQTVEGIKYQIKQNIEIINKKLKIKINEKYIDNIEVYEKLFFNELFNNHDIQKAINSCNKYSEFRKKYQKIYQFLCKKDLIYLLNPIKERDYIHMSDEKLISYIISTFDTYTSFTQHKIYQIAGLRNLRNKIKSHFL